VCPPVFYIGNALDRVVVYLLVVGRSVHLIPLSILPIQKHVAMSICPRPMCPWPKFLWYCVPWTKRPLDIVSLTKPSLNWVWLWLTLCRVRLGLVQGIWPFIQGPNDWWGDIILGQVGLEVNKSAVHSLRAISASITNLFSTLFHLMRSPMCNRVVVTLIHLVRLYPDRLGT